MAGDQDGDAVLAVGPADRPHRLWCSNCDGHLRVGARLPEWNGEELSPDSLLKLGSWHDQTYRESPQRTGKVAGEFGLQRFQMFVGSWNCRRIKRLPHR